MAEKRMVSKEIIESDNFLEMPQSTQLLYFHLLMNGDDDGFVNKTKRIMRTIGVRDDDLKVLISKNFLIPFETGVVVITHWRIHNYLRNDRYKETFHKLEKAQLEVDDNKVYQLTTNGIPNGNQLTTNGIPNGNQLTTNGIPNGNQLTTNGIPTVDKVVDKRYTDGMQSGRQTVYPDKNSIDKNSIDKNSIVVVEKEEKKDEEKKTPATPVATPSKRNEYIKFYNENMGGIMTPYIIQEAESFIDDGLEPELITHAMQIAVSNNAKNWKYAKTILQNWVEKGILTVEQAKAENLQFQQKRNKQAQTQVEVLTAEEQAEIDAYQNKIAEYFGESV